MGVVLGSGEELRSRVVVSNADPKRTVLQVLPASDLDPEFIHRVRGLQTHAAAGLKLHCALSEMPEYRIEGGLTAAQLREATMIVSPNAAYQSAAWRAALQGELPPEPVVAAFLPSVYDATLAPPGKFDLVGLYHLGSGPSQPGNLGGAQGGDGRKHLQTVGPLYDEFSTRPG